MPVANTLPWVSGIRFHVGHDSGCLWVICHCVWNYATADLLMLLAPQFMTSSNTALRNSHPRASPAYGEHTAHNISIHRVLNILFQRLSTAGGWQACSERRNRKHTISNTGKCFSECALLFYMPHSDNVSNIMQGPSVRGGSKTDYVLFHVCCVSYLFFFPLFYIERPRKSPRGISGIIVAALLTCRSGSISFRIDNVPMCDIICRTLCSILFRQLISSEVKNSNFHNSIHESNRLMNHLNDPL